MSDVDPAAVGDRIELLLEASAAAGPVARERAEELVRVVVELYGAGLERLLEIAHDAGALTDDVLDALGADELVSSLLLVHGLHPDGLEARVERALGVVRPSVEDSGATVELAALSDDAVRLRLVGAGSGCGSSAAALSGAIEDAVRAAVPEVARVEVVQDDATLIPVTSLTARLRAPVPT